MDVTFPQNIKILQSVLEKIRDKIQRVEKAIIAQKDKCAEPCKVSCPIPVVSGKDCEDIFRKGGESSQMYLVRPELLQTPYKVYCDQATQNGGKASSLSFHWFFHRILFCSTFTRQGFIRMFLTYFWCSFFLGWLLIQNRLDGSVDFGRRWDDYKRGFGNIAFDVGKGYCETPGKFVVYESWWN